MKLFEKQLWHLIALAILLIGAIVLVQHYDGFLTGSLWGISTKTWLIIALASPIAHQLYVLICWRYELHYKTLSRKFGQKAFKLFEIGFFVLFYLRMFFIIILAVANKNSFENDPMKIYALSVVFILIAIYAFYSVKTYFGMDRAAGLDHFDSSVSTVPFVKKGIFKYTNNGMYKYAFLIIYVPGLLLFSKAALLVGLFSHLYIWVHYYFTELPDMKHIYGTTPKKK